MARDPLRSAIETALEGVIDTALWEECAVSLLRAEVASLVLLTGGDDGGLDAVSIDAEWGLVATTGNAQANLKKNLRRHLEVGGLTRRILFATPRAVTNAQRRKLVATASELGFELTSGQVFDKTAFVERLYRDSSWRKQLLGLSGAPPALSAFPTSLRTATAIPMVGRNEERKTLLRTRSDLLLVGEPGSGKTFLAQALVAKGGALFAVDFDHGRLADAIRDSRPERIILEDVHFIGPQRYADLVHLRTELGLEFSIISTTWPHHMDEWRSITQAPVTVALGPLTRDELVAVVHHAGVTGPNALVRLIVDQSVGRPGLAVLLASASRSGQVLDVARGDVLMQEVANTYRRLLGANSIALLGFLALSGRHGTKVEQAAGALGLDLPTAQELLVGLAHGGALEERATGHLVVVPSSLRAPLVAASFLTGPAPLPLSLLLSHLEEPSAALGPLVEAARLGFPVDEHLLESLLHVATNSGDFAEYASLGERQARLALQLAPLARRLIARASLGVATKFAVRLLLEDSLGDERPRHSNPDHPMRELRDFLGWRFGGMQTRSAVFEAIEEWLDANGDHDVALEAMCLVLRPGWEGSETDPGRGMTLTLSAGLLSVDDLTAMVAILQRALVRLCALEPRTFGPLTAVLNEWAFPSMIVFGQAAPGNDWTRVSRRALRDAIEHIAKCLPARLGLIAQLRGIATHARLRVRLKPAADFEALFPCERNRDWRAADRAQRKAVTALARSWKALSPEQLASLLALYETEAARAGLAWPRWTPLLCLQIATSVAPCLPYARALASRSVPADLVAVFLEPAIDRREPEAGDAVRELLDDPSYEFLAINLSLRREELAEDLMNRAASKCGAQHRLMLETLALRDELRQGSIASLLGHRDAIVARSVAIGMRNHIPPVLHHAWESAIVRCPADEYWYSVIFKNRPALLGRWISAYCERQHSQPNTYEHIPHTISESLDGLSKQDRILLLRGMPASAKSPWLDDVVRNLVGNDADLFEELLRREDLSNFHADGLAGPLSESWFVKAEAASKHGWTADKIISSVLSGGRGWSGDESAHWEGWIREFKTRQPGATKSRLKLISTALKRLEALRADALAQERREAVTGLR